MFLLEFQLFLRERNINANFGRWLTIHFTWEEQLSTQRGKRTEEQAWTILKNYVKKNGSKERYKSSHLEMLERIMAKNNNQRECKEERRIFAVKSWKSNNNKLKQWETPERRKFEDNFCFVNFQKQQNNNICLNIYHFNIAGIMSHHQTKNKVLKNSAQGCRSSKMFQRVIWISWESWKFLI